MARVRLQVYLEERQYQRLGEVPKFHCGRSRLTRHASLADQDTRGKPNRNYDGPAIIKYSGSTY
jgi:hypothetical protein